SPGRCWPGVAPIECLRSRQRKKRLSDGKMRLRPCVHELQGVMMTLMRNGRDRRSENPRCATRGKSACFWLGPISGSHQGQQPNGCTQRPDTWLHPNASRKSQILFPCTAGAVHTSAWLRELIPLTG